MSTQNNKTLSCLRCGKEMQFIKREDIQLGKQSVWHDWNHVLHGSLDVEIYVCPGCGKMEFFAPESFFAEQTFAGQDAMPEQNVTPGRIAARRCDECGRLVGADETVCPVCGETALLLPQVRCPVCGALHDFDDPKCPNCKN